MMTPYQLTEKIIAITAATESIANSVNDLKSIVSIHAADIKTLENAFDEFKTIMATHTEREATYAKTLDGVIRFIVGASTAAFISMVSALAWLLTHSNPWINP